MTASLPTVEDKDPHYFNYYSHLQHQVKYTPSQNKAMN
jgi:hypothetical protein